MHIIIDGYNVIQANRSLRRFERRSVEARRQALVSEDVLNMVFEAYSESGRAAGL